MTGFRTPVAALLAGVLVVFVVLLAMLSGGAVAQTDTENNSTLPPYYDNSSNETGQDAWMEGREDPTLGNITHYIGRLQTFVIGGGVSAQGGIGSAGALLAGGLVILVSLGVGVGSQVGAPAGAALGVAMLSVLSSLGLLPSWMFATFLFLLALVLAAAFLRGQR
jgi:hypothetical protein